MNGSVLRTGREGVRSARTRSALARQTRSWQLRPWPNDPTAKLLVFVDHLAVPTTDDLAAALAEARSSGASTVRTSALFPRSAEVMIRSGFAPIDTLALLRVGIDDAQQRRLDARFGLDPPDTRALRAWHHRRAALVDQDAFGRLWGNDATSLGDIRNATPLHRARWIPAHREMAGFAISGAAGDCGYIQRLAVASPHRRSGVARHLVVDALRWMSRRGFGTVYVNTGVANAPALALYEDLGFVHLDDRLVIAERRLDA